ncbi:MAG: Nif11 family protein [Eubacteriales bacterium]
MLSIDESILSKLTDEQKKKAKSAQSPEEILAIAKEAGYELSAEQLEAIAGGKWEPCWDNCVVYDVCPYFE